MFINEHFTYDGIDSRLVLGSEISIVRTSTGIMETPFGTKRKIVEEQINGRAMPYYFGYTDEPLSFTISLYKEGEWTVSDKNKIISWLFKDGYKRLVSDDDPTVAFYCMPTNDSKKNFNANSEGYLTIEFRCDSPYAWSYPQTHDTFDLSTNTTTRYISLYNRSNINKYYRPIITITMVGDTDFISFVNTTCNNSEFKIGSTDPARKLQNGEVIYFDNDKKVITTTVPSVYRYMDFNKNWLKLITGQNILKVTGKCIIDVYYEYPMAI